MFELASALNSAPCCLLPYRTSSCRLSLQPQSKKTLWVSRRWRCRRRRARSRLWRASRTRRTSTWTSKSWCARTLTLNSSHYLAWLCQTLCPFFFFKGMVHVFAAVLVDAFVPSRALQSRNTPKLNKMQYCHCLSCHCVAVLVNSDGVCMTDHDGFSLTACL